MINSEERKRTIHIFALASFLNDFGSDIIYPIWPLFVREFLGANMMVLGFIDGLGDAIVSISQAISGYISDRIRRRKVFIWTGYTLGVVSRIGYAVSSVWPHLIPFRIMDRAGKIRSAPRDAIIADLSSDQDRGKNFGLLRAMDNLGAVCGIIFCILMFRSLGYRNLFLIAALPTVIGIILILSSIHESKPAEGKIYKGIRFSALSYNFRIFLILSAIFALGAFSYSFLLIYAKEFGFQRFTLPILYLIFTAIASIFSIPMGRFSDRIGRKSVIFLAYLLWVLVCLCLIIAHKVILVIIAFIFYGLHRAALEPVQRSFIAELTPIEYRASGLGGFQMVIGLCALPASFIAGILWDRINLYAPLYFSIGLTVISSLLLILVKREPSRNMVDRRSGK
ncbi:MAG: MFS transporter [candidate division WOR-3 bacterium]